jgi:hypothetical protein
MHKPTPSRARSKLESVSTPSTRFFREKHAFDRNRVRFWRFDRKVPAAYFPLFRCEPAKSPRKTALCFGQVESTFLSKKTKQWKVQTAQETRRNAPAGHARSESVRSSHCDPVNRSCATYCPDCILSFTLHCSKFTIYVLSTTCGYFWPKKVRAMCGGPSQVLHKYL